jgi:hypothetical protein
MKKSYLALIAVAGMLAACDNDPVGTTDAEFMTATITNPATGAVEAQYEGSARFHIGTPPSGGELFQVVSVGRGGLANNGFAITRWQNGQLAVGTYQVGLVDLAGYRETGVPPQGITFQFGRTEGTANPMWFLHETAFTGMVEELYVADSGTLTITLSTATRVAGHFTVSGFRYCPTGSSNALASSCDLPSHTLPGAPRLAISGQFIATPADNVAWPMPAQQ